MNALPPPGPAPGDASDPFSVSEAEPQISLLPSGNEDDPFMIGDPFAAFGTGEESGSFAGPFQRSSPLPVVPDPSAACAARLQEQPQAHAVITSDVQIARPSRRFPWLRLLVISLAVVVVLGALLVSLVQATPSTLYHPSSMTTQPSFHHTTTRGSPGPSTVATGRPVPAPTPFDWVPQTLPVGWLADGLTVSDALDAERTAFTFTDREMSLDFRSVGSRTQHGGTFTASMFLLTAAAKARFAQNDVRMSTNALFDSVQQRHLVQTVFNTRPTLIAFAQQDQQQFALISVSFQLWQVQNGPQTGLTAGQEIDPTTHLPRLHTLVVVLLRVAPGTQGTNAPMGGTGWLVSNYGLDMTVSQVGIVLPA